MHVTFKMQLAYFASYVVTLAYFASYVVTLELEMQSLLKLQQENVTKSSRNDSLKQSQIRLLILYVVANYNGQLCSSRLSLLIKTKKKHINNLPR